MGTRHPWLFGAALLACFVFILAIVFNFIGVKPMPYELASEKPKHSGSSEPPGSTRKAPQDRVGR
jgi:hypothetical protein